MTDIESLDPRIQPRVRKLIWKCAQAHIPVIVLETRRLLSTQMAYYSRGRAPVGLVKEYFKRCGLWDISDEEAKIESTKTLYSKHIDGMAVDIAPAKDGKAWWDAPADVWESIYRIAEEECDLDACYWGRWSAWKWDRPHFEYV